MSPIVGVGDGTTVGVGNGDADGVAVRLAVAVGVATTAAVGEGDAVGAGNGDAVEVGVKLAVSVGWATDGAVIGTTVGVTVAICITRGAIAVALGLGISDAKTAVAVLPGVDSGDWVEAPSSLLGEAKDKGVFSGTDSTCSPVDEQLTANAASKISAPMEIIRRYFGRSVANPPPE